MSLPTNTREGVEKRIEALKWIIADEQTNKWTKQRAEYRLRAWEDDLLNIEIEEADEYIDFILDGLGASDDR